MMNVPRLQCLAEDWHYGQHLLKDVYRLKKLSGTELTQKSTGFGLAVGEMTQSEEYGNIITVHRLNGIVKWQPPCGARFLQASF